MRTSSESYAVDVTAAGRTTPTFKQQSAIPYHARENSLPFSYGQIGTTSTPLRSTASVASKIGNGRIGGVGGYTSADDNNYSFGGENGGGGGGGMLKSQPRLTSPILVRKTLNRSPTRTNSNTNTISNVYHYKYNGDDDDSGGGGGAGGGDNRYHNHHNNNNNNYNSYRRDSGKSGYNTTNGMNGHSSPNNQHFGYNNNNNNYHAMTTNGNLSSSPSLRSRTPTRNDFDELLRERREKVYNEYRATTHDLRTTTAATSSLSSSSPSAAAAAATNRQPPEPPQRQWHLTSSLPNGRMANGNMATTTTTTTAKTTTTKPQQNYNYDFEFNLNLLDELDGSVQLPRRTNTMDRSIFQQQQQQQQYRTRDIPLPPETMSKTTATNSYVERNYHTISSTNAPKERPGIGSGAADMQPSKFTYQQLQPQPQQQPQRTNIAAYGNENVSGYGHNGYSHNSHSNGNIITTTSTEKYEYNDRGSLGGTVNRNTNNNNNNDLSPIYATTTKQTARRNITNNVNFSNNNSNNNNNNNMATITRTTRSTTDYAPQQAPLLSSTSINTTTTLHGSSMGNVSMISRPETPAFPTTPRTPYGLHNGNGAHTPGTLSRSEYAQQQQQLQQQHQETIYQTTYRPRLNSAMSMMNSEPQEVAAHLVKFAKDSSRFWYKPQLTRDEAIALLLNASPGTFVVRDSTTYKNAYGLVVRVATPPAGSATGKPDELVRHFLIEPTTRGVRLKGCANEPVFQSLSALVYEHSINQLALPCLLRIPEQDLQRAAQPSADQMQLLTQGAACNVLWLYSSETESLTGEEAIRKTIRQLYAQKPLPAPLVVHFKVTPQGITLTDNTRKKFFRKHYAGDTISFCAIDPDNRQWSMPEEAAQKKTIFAFVARRSAGSKDNQCHVFCDLAITQPASAIVAFVNKTLPTEKQRNYVL